MTHTLTGRTAAASGRGAGRLRLEDRELVGRLRGIEGVDRPFRPGGRHDQDVARLRDGEVHGIVRRVAHDDRPRAADQEKIRCWW